MRRIVAFLSIVLVSASSAFAQNNSVIFDNQSGEPALVKLIGPTTTELEVANGAKGTVAAAAGRYEIKVRYGVPGRFHYAKGEEFDVTETATARSETTITLHKVVGGNYGTQDISEAEFGKADPKRKTDTPSARPETVESPKETLGQSIAAASTSSSLNQGTAKTVSANSEKTADAWQSDWKEFAKRMVRGAHVLNAREFVGKDVAWKGVLAKVEPPKEGERVGSVHIKMEPPLVIEDPLGRPLGATDTLVLSPSEGEWTGWSALKPNAKVAFRTQLISFWSDDSSPVGCLAVKQPNGVQTTVVVVASKGAALTSVEGVETESGHVEVRSAVESPKGTPADYIAAGPWQLRVTSFQTVESFTCQSPTGLPNKVEVKPHDPRTKVAIVTVLLTPTRAYTGKERDDLEKNSFCKAALSLAKVWEADKLFTSSDFDLGYFVVSDQTLMFEFRPCHFLIADKGSPGGCSIKNEDPAALSTMNYAVFAKDEEVVARLVFSDWPLDQKAILFFHPFSRERQVVTATIASGKPNEKLQVQYEGMEEAVALLNPMWSWLASAGRWSGVYALGKVLVGDPGSMATVIAQCGKPIQLDQVIEKWGKPQAEEETDNRNTDMGWIKSFALETFPGCRILKYPKIKLLVQNDKVIQAAFFGAEAQGTKSSAENGDATKESVSASSESLIAPPASSDKPVRVPPGFRAKEGTSAETYTNTGWAKEIIHEKTGIEMVFIPAGSFHMGSNIQMEGYEKPIHPVRITRPFYMGKYEVTQAEWLKVTGSNPAKFRGDRNPVETVSWDDCQDFLKKAGDGLRLPTEAQWEYACRAGTPTPFYFGYTMSPDQASYEHLSTSEQGAGSKEAYRKQTAAVGSFQPNGWGLYDMHGNVWEWCADWYGNYSPGPVDDPEGPPFGLVRVVRGGAWVTPESWCRSAFRIPGDASLPGYVGLRVARILTEDQTALKSGDDREAVADTNPAAQRLLESTDRQALEELRKRMNFPDGFRPAPGTGPEPYTNTGWAKNIIHEKTGIEMVFIPAGDFQMGSNEAGPGEKPVHRVRITRPFYMGKYEVTLAEWIKVTGSDPAKFGGDRSPVETVSWDDCQDFLKKAGDGLRLPTEAQWEYACRAGTTTDFYFGKDISTKQANYNDDFYHKGSKGGYRARPIEVGTFPPNAWGLYDMHGNVWEWCQDWYGKYPSGSVDDPQGPPSGETRILRGGGWYFGPDMCGSASRFVYDPKEPGFTFVGFGLRVAKTIE